MMTRHGKLSFKDNRPKMSSHSALSRSWSGGGASSYLTQQMSPTSPAAVPQMLGHNFQSPKVSRRTTQNLGTSFKRTTKLPKVPRPNRAVLMFECVKKGIKECIEATEEDIEMLRTSENPPLTSSSTAQQVKAAERYQKRLEFHLAKIEELHDNYLLQQQLREGVRNMAKAYGALPSTNKRDSLTHVKYGYKECTQTMCAIEAQLENMMGTFHCKMKGLVGFARICPGDVFEVSVRHGTQKWKTKGRMASSSQTWDNDTIVFKALMGDILSVKAVELRGLAKTVLLGQKNCESKDLFSSHPQMMTININSNGSLKLRIIVTWNPLEAMDENFSFYEPPPKIQSTPKKFATSPIIRDKESVYVNALDMKDGVHLTQFQMAENGPHSSRKTKPQRPLSSAPDLAVVHETAAQTIGSSGSADFTSQKPHLFDMRLLAESLMENEHQYTEAATLEEALHSLRMSLEDYQGQYTELRKLEEQVILIDSLLRKNWGAGSSRSSGVSISIESALGAFDFLESEDGPDSFDYEPRSRQSSFDHFTETLSPDSTTKTTDSGIESLTNRLNGDSMFASSMGSSPEPPSSGNDAVDQALLWHLGYCERLLENLGNFGPLKCKEIYSLDKLKNQSYIIENLATIAKKGSHVTDLQEVMSECSNNKSLKQFWASGVEHNVLVMEAERMMTCLERHFHQPIRDNYDIPPNRVFRTLIARVLDVPSYDPEVSSKSRHSITMHQFMSYFSQREPHKELLHILDELAGELWITGRVKSGNADIVMKTLSTFSGRLPPTECLHVVALLLITNSSEVRMAAEKYIRSLCDNIEQRDKAMVVFVEALEDRNADVRCASCIALGLLQARESTDQLVYIAQTDVSHVVKVKAKETLFSFGEDGRKAFRDSELTTHGFQGIHL